MRDRRGIFCLLISYQSLSSIINKHTDHRIADSVLQLRPLLLHHQQPEELKVMDEGQKRDLLSPHLIPKPFLHPQQAHGPQESRWRPPAQTTSYQSSPPSSTSTRTTVEQRANWSRLAFERLLHRFKYKSDLVKVNENQSS